MIKKGNKRNEKNCILNTHTFSYKFRLIKHPDYICPF